MTEPTGAHVHEDTFTIQPLPACLAPTPEQIARHEKDWEHLPAARLPRAGDPVMFELGHVTWLVILDGARPVTDHNSLIVSAGRLITGACGDVEWSRAYGVDPEDPNLEPEDAAALPTVRDLLIAHANDAHHGL
ncbi:hypothetical protein [Actinospica robiniae]|uniref:hypothetical protein n=1 Tax=Actinospica robiniae TaxID=304901 RepID=UPI000406CED6|nr:hypothetical protein [Actinospica robiniae]